MKIIILEGIATSGKTSLKEKLSDYFKNKKFRFKAIDEGITLMPILHNTEKDTSLELLEKVISNTLKENVDIAIFDRLYFTHIFRTKSSLSDFSAIEDLLLKQNTLLVLLTIKKELIGQRILKAMNHRGKSWENYVRKIGTDDEIVNYYTDQQDKLIGLISESKLDSVAIDATDRNYDTIKDSVLKRLTQMESANE